MSRARKNDESMAWLCCFLYISSPIGLPDTLARLERHMEIEPR